MKKQFFNAVISVVLFAFSSVGMTAFAEETTTEIVETTAVSETTITTEISEKPTETAVTETSKITESLIETTIVEKTTVDYFIDDYYDTDGNATLIKDENIVYNSEEMQFISVTTKDGHVFYVLINYSAENGEDAVYFLNKVDSYDLYALLYAGDEENNITPEQALQAAENANGRVQNNAENSTENSPETAENEEVSESIQVQGNPMNMNMIYLAIGAVVLVAFGFIAIKFMKKSKKKVDVDTEMEDENYDFYDDSEVDEDND